MYSTLHVLNWPSLQHGRGEVGVWVVICLVRLNGDDVSVCQNVPARRIGLVGTLLEDGRGDVIVFGFGLEKLSLGQPVRLVHIVAGLHRNGERAIDQLPAVLDGGRATIAQAANTEAHPLRTDVVIGHPKLEGRILAKDVMAGGVVAIDVEIRVAGDTDDIVQLLDAVSFLVEGDKTVLSSITVIHKGFDAHLTPPGPPQKGL